MFIFARILSAIICNAAVSDASDGLMNDGAAKHIRKKSNDVIIVCRKIIANRFINSKIFEKKNIEK